MAFVDVTVNKRSYENALLDLCLTIYPNWRRDEIELKAFTHGITNKLIGCFNKSGNEKPIIFRLYGEKTEKFINRDSECYYMQALNDINLAPRIFLKFHNGIAYEYIDGETIDRDMLRQPRLINAICKKLATYHTSNLRPFLDAHDAILFPTMKNYIRLLYQEISDPVKRKKLSLVFPAIENLEEDVIQIEDRLKTFSDLSTTFCHNDLLCKNIIWQEENNEVYFIDYEYSGYNYPAFDIANHFNEYAGVVDADFSLVPDEMFRRSWCSVYLRNIIPAHSVDIVSFQEKLDDLVQQVTFFLPVSHLFWGLWACIQSFVSPIEFNFLAYAKIRIDEYMKTRSACL